MSVQSEINRLNGAKSSLKAAMESLGVTVPESAKIDEYAELVTGTAPYIGENGNWFVAGKDTGVKAQGPQGEPGTPGDPGTQGDPGPAGRGITGVTYSSATNKWTISYSDGSSEQVTGPAIPTQLSQLTGDSTHRTVTDEEKTDWDTAATQAAAAMPKSGGTFTGTVKAGGEGYQAPGTSLLRNTQLVSSDTTPTVNGEIFWTYG